MTCEGLPLEPGLSGRKLGQQHLRMPRAKQGGMRVAKQAKSLILSVGGEVLGDRMAFCSSAVQETASGVESALLDTHTGSGLRLCFSERAYH